MKHETRLRLARLAILLGAAAALLGLWIAGAHLLFLRTCRIASGHVVSAESEAFKTMVLNRYGRDRQTTVSMSTSLVAYDVDGRTYTLDSQEQGDAVEVRYDPRDPERAETGPLSGTFLLPFWLAFFGTSFVLMGRKSLRGY